MQNLKNAAWYGGGLDAVLQPGANRGKVYYVNGTAWGNGSDANTGLRPDVPFMTLTKALSMCTNEQNDTIVVLDFWQPTGETWPIAINKDMVTIVATPGGSRMMPWACVSPTGDTAAFSITATGVTIRNFYLMAGASHAGIELVGGPQRVGIYECFFASGTYGIAAAIHAAGMGLEVAGCDFASALTAGGISLVNPPWGRIHNNVFHGVTGVAISLAAAGSMEILNNTIFCNADVQGRGIILGGGSGCIIDGNHANFGDTAMAANPYLDSSVAGSNHWLLNYQAITAVLPA